MKQPTILASIAVALLLGGSVASAAEARDCRLVVRQSGQQLGAVVRVPTFSAQTTEDLSFSFFLAPGLAADGEHVISIRLRMPGGFLYQDLDLPVVAGGGDGSEETGKRRVKGYPFPVDVVGLEMRESEANGGKTWPWVQMKVPVAGTSIVQSSLYGEWIAEPYLDGEKETPCGRSLRFRIVE